MRVGCAAVAWAAGGIAAAQQPSPSPPRFEGAARLVTVDVVVTDTDGRPVRDLAQSDFHVYEDGRPRPLARFDPPASEAQLEPARAAPIFGGVPRDSASLVLLLDDEHLTIGEARDAVPMLEDLLCRRLASNDRATLVFVSARRWWTAAGGNVCAELVPKLRGLRGLVTDEHDDEFVGAG